MEQLGARIRQRLVPSGFATQRQLAAAVGMKPDALSRALSGERGFSITELVAIGEALHVSVHWLATGDSDPRELSVAARHGYDHVQQARVQVDWSASRPVLENIAMAYEQVQDRSLPRLGSPVPSDASIARSRLIANCGEDFTRSLADAIEASFAVDVVRAAEVDGGFTIGIGRRTVLAVSNTSNWFHQNFSLAHELGHVAAGSMARIDAPSANLEAVERAANSFAADLLLPRSEMRSRDWLRMSPAEVAKFIWDFGVSTKTLASRLESCRIDAGGLGLELRRQPTQRYLRQHLSIAGADENELITRRMQTASRRRFPIGLLSAHRDAVVEGELHAETLAWMLGEPVDAIEAELRPSDDIDDGVDELAALLGFEE
ncbi:MAG: helix-turn-helix domain-containing protein [Curtobacterium sp.]